MKLIQSRCTSPYPNMLHTDRQTDRQTDLSSDCTSSLCMNITVSWSQTLNKVLDRRHLSFIECYIIQLECHSNRRHHSLKRRHLVPPKRWCMCYNSVVSPEKTVILTLTTTKTWCEVTEYCWVASAPVYVPSSATRSPQYPRSVLVFGYHNTIIGGWWYDEAISCTSLYTIR